MATFIKNLDALSQAWEKRGFVLRLFASLLRSRYVMVSVAFYLLLLMVLGPLVVSQYETIRGTFKPEGDTFLVKQNAPSIPPKSPTVTSTAEKPNAGQSADRATEAVANKSTGESLGAVNK